MFDNRVTLPRRQRQRVYAPLSPDMAPNRIALPLGKAVGQTCSTSCRGPPSLVNGVACLRRRDLPQSAGANEHEPIVRGPLTPDTESSRPGTVAFRPSDSEIAFRTPEAVTTAIDRPSGENMHDVALSLPRTGVASYSIERSHVHLPSATACADKRDTKAIRRYHDRASRAVNSSILVAGSARASRPCGVQRNGRQGARTSTPQPPPARAPRSPMEAPAATAAAKALAQRRWQNLE